MKNSGLFLDIHVLQTVPPSCVNRDDTGSPKTAIYGGTTRARVSSQAWKKAMRDMFRDEIFDEEQVGVRTKKVVDLVADEICVLDPSYKQAKAKKLAETVLTTAGIELKDEKKSKKQDDPEGEEDSQKETKALFFISATQVRAIAKIAVSNSSYTPEKLRELLREYHSIDIALFGRMVASEKNLDLNVDAAAQVAHAISTHAVYNEYDYFTAVDDYSSKDSVGAAHLGTNEFNASTMYRYATVNLTNLKENLKRPDALENKPDIPEIARGFIEAFVRSMPTGKQNTFANRTLPDAVYVTLRRDQPINLCGAFENAVKAGENGYAVASGEALVKHAKEVYNNYTAAPDCAFVVGNMLGDLAETVSFPELLNRIAEQIDTYLGESEGV